MIDPTLQTQVDAARAYEALFVPAVFGQWAQVVVDAVPIVANQRVLDVACGTGALTRVVRSRVGPNGAVAGLDPSAGMLSVAKELVPDADLREGSAGSMPFAEASFDSVVSQFGLMFFPDRDLAVREMLRVLRPGGRLAVLVWNDLRSMPAYAAEVDLLERVVGTAAADALRAPFVLGDRDQLAELFTAAGASAVAVATHRGRARFPSIRVMVEAELRGWLPVMGVTLDEDQIARILGAAEDALSAYSSDHGVSFDLQAHLVTATRP